MRAFAALTALLLLAAPAGAREVRVPLRLDFPFLRELLVRSAYTDPEQTAQVYTDGVDCKHVRLSQPQVSGAGGLLRVESDVDAKLGTLVLGICLFPVSWQGRIRAELESQLAPTAPIVGFRVRDSRLLERDGSERGGTGVVWDWLKSYAAQRLELLTIDLAAPVADLREVLPLFLAREGAARAQALVDSLALERVDVNDANVVVEIRLRASDVPIAARPPEPALTPEEAARFESELARWDGFITYVVKQAGAHAGQAELRERLLDVLLEAREELVDTLARPAEAGPDPVRPLFVSSWKRLAEVLRDLGPGLGDRDALRYLGFIAAADALAALDGLGPALGLEMSSDGLRRLARVLAPDDPADPLDAPEAVDTDLRRALGLGEPLPEPAPDSGEPAPDPPAPTPEGVPPSPPPESPPESRLEHWLSAALDWLFGGSAHAATARLTGAPNDQELARLRRWVPERAELDVYLPLMRRLLRWAAEDASLAKPLSPPLRNVFFDLQLATAWQETCWRHYVRLSGEVKPIRSRAGAVGVMQVNVHVWRGLYDPRFLSLDPAYNARAGSEILLHYFTSLARDPGEAKPHGDIDTLVRASYAAYNGGPGQLRRYRAGKIPKRLKSIDSNLFDKYQKVRAGKELEVARCFG
jgi:hypothetical protein